MNRITALVSLLLVTATACVSDVDDVDTFAEESTEAAVSGLSKKDAVLALKQALQCESGDKSFAKDNCNTCVCHDGAWACTKKLCTLDDSPEDIAVCKPGQVKKADDGCNTCACIDAGWACTLKLCIDEGDVNDDAVCKDGATAPAKDGCNTCKCSGDAWTCTQDACDSLPPKKKPLH